MELPFRTALLAWLAADPLLAASLNTITEEAPLRASPPWLGIVASASSDFGHKTGMGREVQVVGYHVFPTGQGRGLFGGGEDESGQSNKQADMMRDEPAAVDAGHHEHGVKRDTREDAEFSRGTCLMQTFARVERQMKSLRRLRRLGLTTPARVDRADPG